MKFRAVLFDLDGTLLNSLEDLADSMNMVLERFGFPTHEVEKFRYFVGDGMQKLVYRALPEEQRDEEILDKCFDAMRSEYHKRCMEKTHPYKGIPEMLDALQVSGAKMAILSNKPDDLTKMIVSKLLSRWPFARVVGARQSVPKKPHPMAALEIARYLAITAEEFLYAGDTSTDMQTAQAAGMHPVGVLWGFRTAEELMKGGAKALIESPMDLIGHL